MLYSLTLFCARGPFSLPFCRCRQLWQFWNASGKGSIAAFQRGASSKSGTPSRNLWRCLGHLCPVLRNNLSALLKAAWETCQVFLAVARLPAISRLTHGLCILLRNGGHRAAAFLRGFEREHGTRLCSDPGRPGNECACPCAISALSTCFMS